MECRAVLSSLSEYLDGQNSWLSASEVREIDNHLASCSGCQRVKVELSEIRTAARELPLHTPPRAMWTRIANTIEAEMTAVTAPLNMPDQKTGWWEKLKSRKFSVSVPQLAGAGAIAVAAMIFGLNSFSPTHSVVMQNLPALTTALLPDEDRIKADIERRLAAINARKATWDPQARAEFDTHLNKVEESLNHCRQMLQANPGDKVQQQMVLSLYNEKRQLLDDVERLKW